ncbi:MAG TPA: acyl-CoA dehydrogenase family protein [Micromonosporaceae bacterium]|jgi:alkylation response protein AidB-like acyl-CoA dehydrogenase
MKDLLYSDVETQLRDGVRDALARRSPVATVLAGIESGQPYDRDLWRTLAVEMGLAGIAVPEKFGGAGGSLREAAVVLEELGRGVAPVPYLTSAIVATSALLACGAGDELAALASGQAIAVLAVPFAKGPFPGTAGAPAVAVDADGYLSGTVAGVADALAATLLLVPTADGLYAVDASAPGVTRAAVVPLDLTRPIADVSLAAVAGRRVAEGPQAAAAVDAGLLTGAALLASEQLGVAQWCLDTTVEYVKQRHQFGRPVGSFQAVKHRLADVWVELTQVRAVARHAAACAAEGDADLAVAASLAQAFCSPAAVHAAEECVQLHGGIGFTWEHPAHLFLKRAKADAIAYGTADRHRVHLAALVDLPG